MSGNHVHQKLARFCYDDSAFKPQRIFKSLGGTLRKTLKFRAVTMATTLGLTWLLTGNPIASLGFTAIQQGANTVVYYFFEKSESAKPSLEKHLN